MKVGKRACFMAPNGSMRLNKTQSPSTVKYGYEVRESGKYEFSEWLRKRTIEKKR